MVACPKCVVNNTLDSAFCKKCGAILPVAVIEEEQAKLKEIVTKGMESYQNGNLDEGMAIADHSILTNPSYGEAYALKGLIHERRGEYAEALDAYETVVALNPDSTIDKIKLNQLRNAFAQRQAGAPRTDRRGAALMGLAAMLLVISVSGVVYGVMQSSHETKQAQSNNVPVQTKAAGPTNVGNNVNAQAQNQPAVDPNKPNPGNHEAGDEPALGSPDNNPEADTSTRLSSRRRYNGGGGGVVNFGDPTGPAIVSGSIGNTLPTGQPDGGGNRNKPVNSSGQGTVDPPVSPDNGNSRSDNAGPKVVAKDPDVGSYQISVASKSDGTKGDSGAPSHSNSGRNYQQQARDQARSGKTAQARDSYQKAIDAYQKDISSGKGDKDAAEAGINSCKQALKNLKD